VVAIKSFAAWFTFPLILLAQIGGFAAALELGFNPGLTLLAVTIANMTVIALLELWLPDRPDWSWARDGQVVNDIVHGLGNEFAGGIGRALLFIIFATIGGKLAEEGSLGLWPNAWPFWTQVLAAVFIVDFFDYWKHRAYHAWAFAWPIHALHHNMDRMHVFKGIRLHFLEAAIRSLVVYSPLVVLGASADVMIWIAALMTFGGSLNHSNLKQDLPRFVHALLPTQRTHWLHHNKDYDRGACNLSPLTMWCDHLFGTFRHPLDEELHEVGIAPDPIPKNLPAQLASPLIWPLLIWLSRRACPIPNKHLANRRTAS
jgi:sterol desaturase/sphingolipid hydroxylase (fatty acid hydroxylase superfamily)